MKPKVSKIKGFGHSMFDAQILSKRLPSTVELSVLEEGDLSIFEASTAPEELRAEAEVALRVVEAVLGPTKVPLWQDADGVLARIEAVLGKLPSEATFAEMLSLLREAGARPSGMERVLRIRQSLRRREGRAL